MSATVDLIVGLGNPGNDYADSRHNAGFWCVDRLARAARVEFREVSRFRAALAQAEIDGHVRWLLKPMNYMNNSGQVVGAFARYYGIVPERMLIVHDELDLEVGTARLKIGGGPGGHNGLRDLIAHLSSNAFMRLRLGVAHPGDRSEVTDYLLKRVSRADRELIEQAIDRALEFIGPIVNGRIEAAMNELHRRPQDNDDEAD